MSTIGKFFVVLNLALAALFVGASASLIAEAESYRTQYEDAVETHATKVSELEAESADWQSKYNDAIAENQRLLQQNGQVQCRDIASGQKSGRYLAPNRIPRTPEALQGDAAPTWEGRSLALTLRDRPCARHALPVGW